MKFDNSEMTTLNQCDRKWLLSSRNGYHLRPTVTPEALTFGTLFHECLAALYLGGDIDTVIAQGKAECKDSVQEKVLENMIGGYYDEVLFDDLEVFRVLDIEHSVNYELPELRTSPRALVAQTEDINEKDDGRVWVVGSIDLIVLCLEDRPERDLKANHVYFLEHKSCKKFRDSVYFVVDSQPRVYYFELLKYVAEYNRARAHIKNFVPVQPGGVFINEVKKVQRKFDHCRRLCTYNETQQNRFYQKLLATGARIRMLQANPQEAQCNPGYMTCSMCEFAPVCETYAYDDISFEQFLEEFGEEYQVREHDHLEEKSERKIDI